MTACINPQEIEPGDLMAYIDGDADPQVQAHLEACPHCQAEAKQLAHISGTLLANFYRDDCPSASDLAQWQQGLLSAPDALKVAAHVRTCPHCTQDMQDLLADDVLSHTLFDLLKKISQWVEVFPHFKQTETALRGGERTGPQYFTLPELEIMLESQETSNSLKLMGRLKAPPGQRASVANLDIYLAHHNTLVENQTSNKRGQFIFRNLSPGLYDVGFEWQEQLIILRDVKV